MFLLNLVSNSHFLIPYGNGPVPLMVVEVEVEVEVESCTFDMMR